jgi:FKBP-type peptidyl-prolyl cis-trans isomerase 2
MNDRISKGATVALAYRLLDTDGRLLEERTPDAPAVFVQGEHTVLPAIERALEGQTAGYASALRLAAVDAYGEYDPTLLVEVERARFPSGADLSPGQKFSTAGPDGTPIAVRVLDADEEIVALDGNHPLAGLDLLFELNVLSVQAPGGGGEQDEPFSDRFSGSSGALH